MSTEHHRKPLKLCMTKTEQKLALACVGWKELYCLETKVHFPRKETELELMYKTKQ
jgi:hypothetical protein